MILNLQHRKTLLAKKVSTRKLNMLNFVSFNYSAVVMTLFILNTTDVRGGNNLFYNKVEQEIIIKYESLLADRVTLDLLVDYKNYLESPNRYWHFLNETLLNNWDFDGTAKALIGSEIYSSLSNLQFKKLSRAIEITFIRYAFESLSFYDEQRLNVVDIKLNKQQTLAWLRIKIESPRFLDTHLDLLLRRTEDQWKSIDFRFKGISHVNMKTYSYRQYLGDLKFEGLLSKLESKNKVFFKNLCSAGGDYINPKEPPCL